MTGLALRRWAAALVFVVAAASLPALACRARERPGLDAACAAPGEVPGDCPAACRSRGVVVMGERRLGSGAADVQATSTGCAACGPLGAGAPAGAPCQAASVCAEVCCACASGPGHHVVRACRAGACASGEAACAFTREDAVLCPE